MGTEMPNAVMTPDRFANPTEHQHNALPTPLSNTHLHWPTEKQKNQRYSPRLALVSLLARLGLAGRVAHLKTVLRTRRARL